MCSPLIPKACPGLDPGANGPTDIGHEDVRKPFDFLSIASKHCLGVSGNRQSDFLAKRRKSRIVAITQNKGIGKQPADA